MALRAKSLMKFLLIVVILGAVGTAVYLRIQKEKDEEAEGTTAGAQANQGDRAEAVEGLFRGLDPIPVRATPTVEGTLVQTVHAEVPLREVTTYARTLSSMTGGQGSYSMDFSRYETVPGNIQQDIMAKAKLKEEED